MFPRYLEIFRNLPDVHERAIREVLSGDRSNLRWSVAFVRYLYIFIFIIFRFAGHDVRVTVSIPFLKMDHLSNCRGT